MQTSSLWRDTLKALLIGAFFFVSALSIVGHNQVRAQDLPASCSGGTIPTTTHCTYIPLIAKALDLTQFSTIPVMSGPVDRPAAIHGDINLALRGYVATTATLELLDINGPTDIDAPQLNGLFLPPRLPAFRSAYQVNEWDWSCDTDGCRGSAIAAPPVTLLGLAASPGESIYIPTRSPQIYAGNYKAMVLYAEERRITLVYTRDDTAAFGYVLHLENLIVSPNLVALYQQLDAAGRTHLPALREGESLGSATSADLLVAIRDTGSFMDPRSRKDWWMGYVE